MAGGKELWDLEMKWMPRLRSCSASIHSDWWVIRWCNLLISWLSLFWLQAGKTCRCNYNFCRKSVQNVIAEISNWRKLKKDSCSSLPFNLPFVWIAFEWEMAEKQNKTYLGVRTRGCGFSSADMHLAYVEEFSDKQGANMDLVCSFSKGYQDVHVWLNYWCWATPSISWSEDDVGPYLLGITIDHSSYWSLHKYQDSH